MAELNIIDFLTMSESNNIYAYYPFRQMYLEMNGWVLSDQLYYKVGADYFSELNFLNSGKNTYAFTVPSHWAWKLSNGSSVTTYLEIQSKIEKQLDQEFIIANEKNYMNQYMSFSYNHFGKWTLTGFYDREDVNDKVHQWPGLDFSFLIGITAVDYVEYFELIYHLRSMKLNQSVVLKTRVFGRDEPIVPSLIELWPGADLQEREIWDLMGIKFDAHPNLKRILLWEGFSGHPLRKDYLG